MKGTLLKELGSTQGFWFSVQRSERRRRCRQQLRSRRVRGAEGTATCRGGNMIVCFVVGEDTLINLKPLNP